MCIRDSASTPRTPFDSAEEVPPSAIRHVVLIDLKETTDIPCLLYTSDAADERSSVDLGGRRIIKKKKKIKSLS